MLRLSVTFDKMGMVFCLFCVHIMPIFSVFLVIIRVCVLKRLQTNIILILNKEDNPSLKNSNKNIKDNQIMDDVQNKDENM